MPDAPHRGMTKHAPSHIVPRTALPFLYLYLLGAGLALAIALALFLLLRR